MKRNILSFSLLVIGLLAYSSVSFSTEKNRQRQRGKSVVTIGLFADPQYADLDSRGARLYRSALKKLPECISVFNERKVDMVACLGDVVDRSPEESDTIFQIVKSSESPVYYVMGNHDFSGLDDVPDHLNKSGMPSLYYAITEKNWKFIFLNTNDVSAYTKMSPEKKLEYEEMTDRMKREGAENNRTWNGGVGKEQMQWLSRELRTAENAGLRVIVFAHHPIFPLNDHTVLNYKEVLDLLLSYKSVKAYINGHYHPGKFAVTKEGLACISLEAMVEGGEDNSFAILRLGQDSMYMKGYGRVKSHVIPYRQ